MFENDKSRLQEIVSKIKGLTNGQIMWLEKVVSTFERNIIVEEHNSDLFEMNTLESFGDALRIHHCFSSEPFSKDKFEYVLQQVLKLSGNKAILAPKGNRGHDITINDEKFSLKTQADKGIKLNEIWISKFMELGRGTWADDPKDLIGLRKEFIQHLSKYDRILSLRNLQRAPDFYYELVEIPKELLLEAEDGEMEMKHSSRQLPKPGYCHVRDSHKNIKFQLYFDGGGERKLQVKRLDKTYCTVHATWSFTIPPEKDSAE